MFFTSSQRRGVIFLILILALFSVYNVWYKRASEQLEPLKITEHLKKAPLNLKDHKKHKVPTNRNPNYWKLDDWLKLGFSKNQISSILNYKNKIGGFKSKKQLFNCYVINLEKRNKLDSIVVFPKAKKTNKQLSEYILLKKSKKPDYNLIDNFDTIFYEKFQGQFLYYLKKNKPSLKLLLALDSNFDVANNTFKKNSSYLNLILKKQKIKFNVNKVGVEELVKIKKIGPKTAKQIISFRNVLGGFVKVSQMKEVYLVNDTLYENIKSYFFVDNNITKININTSKVDSLKKHPYISWNLANAIVNFRAQHGVYYSVEKIKEIHLVNDKIYLKIAPYLKI